MSERLLTLKELVEIKKRWVQMTGIDREDIRNYVNAAILAQDKKTHGIMQAKIDSLIGEIVSDCPHKTYRLLTGEVTHAVKGECDKCMRIIKAKYQDEPQTTHNLIDPDQPDKPMEIKLAPDGQITSRENKEQT